jgi:hypothetical protein
LDVLQAAKTVRHVILILRYRYSETYVTPNIPLIQAFPKLQWTSGDANQAEDSIATLHHLRRSVTAAFDDIRGLNIQG